MTHLMTLTDAPGRAAMTPTPWRSAVLGILAIWSGIGCTDASAANVADTEGSVDAADVSGDTPAASPTVLPGAGPVITTLSWGIVIDLATTPCVSFTIEAEDADSESLQFTAEGLAPGAELLSQGSQATIEWCPTGAQMADTVSWPFVLEVSDGTYAVRRPYQIWLLPEHGEPCPGTASAPAIGASPDAPLAITDSFTVHHSPTGAGSETRAAHESGVVVLMPGPEGRDAFSDWVVLPRHFVPGEAQNFPALRRYWVLPELVVDEPTTITVAAIAEANRDPNGSACDETIAVVESRQVTRPRSELSLPIQGCLAPCVSSAECESGACVQSMDGNLCDNTPRSAYCPETAVMVTVEGTPVEVCAPFYDVCYAAELPVAERAVCRADRYEPNDTMSTATRLEQDAEEAELCPGDVDVYRVDVEAGQTLRAELANGEFNFTRAGENLDSIVTIRDGTGRTLARSDHGYSVVFARDASGPTIVGVSHLLEARAATETSMYIEIAGRTDNAYQTYTLRTEVRDEPCDNDAAEPDDSPDTPRVVTSGQDASGMICRSDEDWLAIDVAEPGVLDIAIAFDWDATDLDAEVYAPDGALIASLVNKAVDEQARVTVEDAGRYLIRIYGWGFSGCLDNDCSAMPTTAPAGTYTARISSL